MAKLILPNLAGKNIEFSVEQIMNLKIIKYLKFHQIYVVKNI